MFQVSESSPLFEIHQFCFCVVCIFDSLLVYVKPRSHCPGVRPGAPRQFAAGGPGRTGTNREGIRVRSYISGSATDQTRFGAKNKSRSVPVMLRFATVHSRFSSGGATVCPGASRYTTEQIVNINCISNETLTPYPHHSLIMELFGIIQIT